MSSQPGQQPSPQLFFQTINAYQRTEALKAAIELDVFTAIGEGNATTAELASRCETSERGMRILSDFLCTMGFLNKDGNRYSLTPDSAARQNSSPPKSSLVTSRTLPKWCEREAPPMLRVARCLMTTPSG
jgi:hypothetical protein